MNLGRKIIYAGLFLAAVLAGPSTPLWAQRFAYAANFSDNNVTGYSINTTTGALTSIGTFAKGTGTAGAVSVALTAPQTFVLVAYYLDNAVSAFKINGATGALTLATGCPPGFTATAATGTNPISVAIDSFSQTVYVANWGSNNISGYLFDGPTAIPGVAGTGTNSGCLKSTTGSPFAAGTNPGLVFIDHQGEVVVVPNFTSNNVSSYTINTSAVNFGSLSQVTGSPFAAGTNPSSAVIPNFRDAGLSREFLYVPNGGSNTISAYTVSTATATLGQLTAIAGPATGTNPAVIAVDSTNSFIYVTNWGANTVSGYSFASGTGTLTPLTNSPFAAGSGPFEITTDSLNFAYVANENDGVTAYNIGLRGFVGQLVPVTCTGLPCPGGVAASSVAAGNFPLAVVAE